MKYKKSLLGLLLACIVILVCTRYYSINKDVPSKFTIDYSSKSEVVKCDNLEIKVLSAVKGNVLKVNKMDIIPITIETEIKNISDHVTSAALFIESPLGIGNYKSQTNNGKFNKNQIKSLKPNEEMKVKLTYEVNKEILEKNDDLILYLPTKLYNSEIKKIYEEGIRYGKAITL